jgi:hypothetical protein
MFVGFSLELKIEEVKSVQMQEENKKKANVLIF